MLNDLKVKVGPQYYRYHPDAIDSVAEVLNHYQAKNILIVHGTISWEKAEPLLTFTLSEEKKIFYHQYTGECSYHGVDLIEEVANQKNIDFIIGVGGGKLTDLVGYAANKLHLNFGVIPTLASNCAPWTPLSVMYKENGESEGKTEHYLNQAAFFVTDPRLIIDAPVEYFIAGLADTLAKWYESELILEQEHLREEPFIKMARYTAELCRNAIENDSVKAIESMKRKELSAEFVHLSEIVFALSGLVGGFGDKYARNAAAHAMHDALGKYVPESHQLLHGEKVAYGIFYQLAIEQRWEIIDQLIPFYQELNLPMSLGDMQIVLDNVEVVDKIVTFIDSKEKVHIIPTKITTEILKNGLYDLEEYNKKV